MTVAQKNELAKIRKAMNNMDFAYVDAHWDRYLVLERMEQEEYRESNEDKLVKFYNERICGKTWDEIDPEDWEFYSDWHKDMYGYRPRLNGGRV